MIFPSGLKRICDISFYMTFASIAGAIFGGDDLILTLPIFVFVAFLSAFLAPYGRIRYFSVIPLFLVFVVTPLTVVNVLILGVAIVFMIRTLPRAEEWVAGLDYESTFRLFSMIFGWIVFIVFVINGLVGNTLTDSVVALPSTTLLFAMSFFLNSIIFMRLIRHDESVLKQTRFKMMNIVSLIVVIIAVIFLSTDLFLTFVRDVIRFVWSHLLVPIIGIVAWLFEFVVWLIFLPITFIIRILGVEGGSFLAEFPEMPAVPSFEEVYEYEGASSNSLNLFLVLLVIILIVLGVYLLKILANNKTSGGIRDDGIEEERFSLDRGDVKKKTRFGRSEENQIREVYRKFLIHVKKKEINIPLHSTSCDVENLVTARFDSKKSSELRTEYIRVRYGEAEYTKDDVRHVKELYKEVKKELTFPEIKEEIERF